jgi:hypothetical protein
MIKDIQIMSIDDDGRLSVSFPTGVTKTTSSFNLIQRIVKRILTLQGSDALYPEIGTNIPELFRFVDNDNKTKIAAFFPIFLKDIENELLREQTIHSNLPAAQKLSSLELVDVYFDEAAWGWVLSIKVSLENQTSLTVTI